jgi:hypothetical protein
MCTIFYNEEQWKFNILITFNAQETELKQFSISEFSCKMMILLHNNIIILKFYNILTKKKVYYIKFFHDITSITSILLNFNQKKSVSH